MEQHHLVHGGGKTAAPTHGFWVLALVDIILVLVCPHIPASASASVSESVMLCIKGSAARGCLGSR